MEAICIQVSVEMRGPGMGGCCLLKYLLLGQICVLNMEIFGCVHGKAWNPSLITVGLFL